MMNLVRRYLSNLSQRWGDGWNQFWFAPSDPFPLAVLRIGAGLIALYLQASLAFDLIRFFGPGGMLPVETVRQLEAAGSGLSYFNYLHTAQELWLAYGLGLVITALFTVGFYSRVTSILTLVVMLSTINRGPMLSSQAEGVLTMLLFYLCLGPCGTCVSVDAWTMRRRSTPESALSARPSRFSTAATLALRLTQVHLCMFYGVMGLSKLFGEVWWSGRGMWWLIARPDSRLIDLTWLPQYGIEFWAHCQVAFELSFAILIWNRTARPLMLAFALVMWPLLALVTGQIPFCATMLVANLAFFSPEFYQACCGMTCAGKPRGPVVIAPADAVK